MSKPERSYLGFSGLMTKFPAHYVLKLGWLCMGSKPDTTTQCSGNNICSLVLQVPVGDIYIYIYIDWFDNGS